VSLERALERFESLLQRDFPGLLAQLRPGLDDAGVDYLKTALRPMHLPAGVEALYRWRDGGDAWVFGGWRLRPVDELLTWRAFCLTDLDEPPAWLQLFDDQILGFTTLGVDAQEPSDGSVWYGHTHDGWVERLVDSVEDLVDVCSDALDAGLLARKENRLSLEEQSFDGRAWAPLRLARCPGAFQFPDPPAGTYLSRLPDEDWPEDWTRSFGVDAE
jgi:hypothetical protein